MRLHIFTVPLIEMFGTTYIYLRHYIEDSNLPTMMILPDGTIVY